MRQRMLERFETIKLIAVGVLCIGVATLAFSVVLGDEKNRRHFLTQAQYIFSPPYESDLTLD